MALGDIYAEVTAVGIQGLSGTAAGASGVTIITVSEITGASGATGASGITNEVVGVTALRFDKDGVLKNVIRTDLLYSDIPGFEFINE